MNLTGLKSKRSYRLFKEDLYRACVFKQKTYMEDVKLGFDEKGYGKFSISEENEQIAEMVISITGNDLTVYHTEVFPKGEGKGLAKKLLAAMVDHARQHALKVIPLCPYVHAQFKRHPDEYADVWSNN